MTISSTNSRNDYIGNAAVSSYSYTFKIFVNTHIQVTVRDTDDVETVLTLTTDYTVSGVGALAGGAIALVNSGQSWLTAGKLKTGYALTIRRVVPIKQETDIRNQGAYYAEVHEEEFDYITMALQQQQNDIDGAVKLPETIDPADFDATLPAEMVGNVGKTLVVNSTGDGFDVGPSASDIAGASGNATAAADSATAAAASAVTSAAYAAALNGTSTTSLAIATGSKSFTTQASKQFAAGQFIMAVDAANNANFMHGQVISYSGTSLVIDVQSIGGSGTIADWKIYVSGNRGATGAAGTNGTDGVITALASQAEAEAGSENTKGMTPLRTSQAITALAPKYVDRGDPSSMDFAKAAWTIDSAFHDWDLSSIVPAGAKAVVICGIVNNSVSGAPIQFRKNGNSNSINMTSINSIAGISMGVDVIVALDTNRIIEYYIYNAGTWSGGSGLTVKGWFL